MLQFIIEHRAKCTSLAVYWLGIHIREYVEQIPNYYYNALRIFLIFVHMVPALM